MQTLTPLEPGEYYHIYNRGVNRTNLFIEDRNFAYFMQLYAKHIFPVAETFAYCLMPNHFHFLVRIRTDRLGFENQVGLNADGLDKLDRRAVSQAFNNWLNAYAKAINKAYDRTGSLFQHHFGRLLVTSDRYFVALVRYIHGNPQKHGFVTDFREWPHSSYRALLSGKSTKLEGAMVFDWFGGLEGFQRFHAMAVDESTISEFIGEDDD
jgi:REP element-mobilizing transposase RayT